MALPSPTHNVASAWLVSPSITIPLPPTSFQLSMQFAWPYNTARASWTTLPPSCTVYRDSLSLDQVYLITTTTHSRHSPCNSHTPHATLHLSQPRCPYGLRSPLPAPAPPPPTPPPPAAAAAGAGAATHCRLLSICTHSCCRECCADFSNPPPHPTPHNSRGLAAPPGAAAAAGGVPATFLLPPSACILAHCHRLLCIRSHSCCCSCCANM